MLWAIWLVLWVVTLPIRLVFGILGLIGFGRLLQLGVVGAIGYFFYRLVNQAPPGALPPAPSETTLRSTPST